jgi:O-antigen ligase
MKLRISLIVFVLVIIFPNSVPGLGADNGRRVASILLVLFGSLALLYRGIKVDRDNFPLFFLLTLQVAWVAIVTVITTYLEPGNVTYGNFTELLRVFAILLFFLLGSSFAPYLEKKDLITALKAIMIVTFVLVVCWIFRNPITNFFSSFYLVREGRFSGLTPAVNYIWVPTLLTMLLALYNLRQDNNWTRWVLLTGAVLVSILSLLLSSSNTSFIATIIGIMAYILWSAESKKRVFKYYLVTGSILLFLAYTALAFVEGSSLFDRGVDRFVDLYFAFSSADLSEVQSFSRRLDLWGRALDEIYKSPLIGHGTSKINFQVMDSNYLMTVYRFGIIGFIIEMLFYITSIYVFYKRNRFNKIYAIPLSFIIAFMAAGITTATFYELKAPYILSFFIGLFAIGGDFGDKVEP